MNQCFVKVHDRFCFSCPGGVFQFGSIFAYFVYTLTLKNIGLNRYFSQHWGNNIIFDQIKFNVAMAYSYSFDMVSY